MSSVDAVGAVRARIGQIHEAIQVLRTPTRPQPGVPAGVPAGASPGAPSNALGTVAAAEVMGGAATAAWDAAAPAASTSVPGMSSLAGMVEAQVASPASTTTGAAWSPPPGSSSFDQVFAAAVQQLRTQWGPQGAVAAWSGGAVGPQWTGPSSGVAGAASVAGTAGVAGVAGSVSPGTPYAALFEDAGRRHGIPPRVLAAIGWVESRFRLDAVSSAGALGMMQFLPGTAASMGVDPYDPASAIDGAARYLRHALDRFGSLEQAIASYNVGPGTIARAGGVQPGTQAERYLVNVIEATARI